MQPYEVAAAFFTVFTIFGSIVLIVRTVVHSPRRKALAEAEKQERLKELGLLEAPQAAEMRTQLQEKDAKIADLVEERDFLRKLLEEREKGDRSAS